ncbi:hypothetical protein PRIPAC_93217 [Pristionchus pacificus]|nr:hypothetical protein PRIPAC_93217 [Pristionchus pacificus]|eukprot:PDM67704.1 hypothetical protein PRIPAC_45748 [Pristionchus pacificus]
MRLLLVFASLFVICAAQLDLFKGSGISTTGENNPLSNIMSGILNPDQETRRNRYRSRYSNENDYDESDRDLLRRIRNRNRDRTDAFGNRYRSDRYDREEEYETNSNPLGSLLGSGTSNTNNPFNLGGLLGR